jgi:hypothetical protein
MCFSFVQNSLFPGCYLWNLTEPGVQPTYNSMYFHIVTAQVAD